MVKNRSHHPTLLDPDVSRNGIGRMAANFQLHRAGGPPSIDAHISGDGASFQKLLPSVRSKLSSDFANERLRIFQSSEHPRPLLFLEDGRAEPGKCSATRNHVTFPKRGFLSEVSRNLRGTSQSCGCLASVDIPWPFRAGERHSSQSRGHDTTSVGLGAVLVLRSSFESFIEFRTTEKLVVKDS